MKKSLLILLSLLLTPNLWAATYYLDATLGSDSSADPTNISTPWKTANKVKGYNGFVGGDSILFKCGENFQTADPVLNPCFIYAPTGVSPSAPITFGSYGTGAKPVVGAFRFHNLNNVIVSGIEFTNNASMNGFMVDHSNNFDVSECVFRGLGVNGRSIVQIQGSSSSEQSYNIKIHHSEVTDDTITANGSITAFADSTVSPGVKTKVTSAGHSVTDGMMVSIENTTNYNQDYTASNITASTFDINTAFVADDATGLWHQTKSSGINVSQFSHDIYIEDNDVHDLDEIGIQAFDVDYPSNNGNAPYNIFIYRNRCYDIGFSNDAKHGINVGWNVYNSIVEGNYCYNNSTGIAFDAYCHDITARNNIVEDNVFGFRVWPGAYNISIINNTLHISNTGIEYYTTAGSGNILKDNIFWSDYLSARFIMIGDSGITSDYNLFYNTTGTYTFYISNVAKTLAQWKSLTGNETNSKNEDPLFLGTSYLLTTSSPCKNAGTDVGNPFDYRGIKRDSQPDIGAYEFVTGTKYEGVTLVGVTG